MSKNIKLSLLLIATMGIMSGITIVSSLPLMSRTFSDIPNIEFLSKMMLTIPSIIIAMFAPVAGILVDRYGRLKPLYVGMVLFVAGGSSGFYLDNFYYILIGRAILGIAVALLMTSSTALIGDYYDEDERHKFMSLQGMSVAIGGIVFITAGGFLAEWHWSYPFAIYALPLLFMPMIYLSLYEPMIYKHTTIDSGIDRSLLSVYITASFSMILFYMLPTQLPYLIINTMHGDPKTIGFIISISMVFNAITARQYGRLKNRFSYIQIYIFTFAIFGTGLFIISQADDISQLFYSTIFIGMGFGLIFVNTNSWFLSRVAPQKRGKASGILASSFFIGQFSSPLIFEPIVNIYGIQGLFFIISLVSISISIVLLIRRLYIR
jgi:MFS family permease